MKKTDTNSIRYPSNVDEKLEKLSQGLGRSKKELFCQMVDYFYRSKKDPVDWGDEILKKQLSSGINRILSFIRQQEKDFILPLFTDSGLLKNTSAKQKQLLEAIGKYLMAESEKTKGLVEQSEYLAKGIKIIVSKQEEKQKSKEQFSEILEYYITQREEMGWPTSGIKREKLVLHVRKLLQNLKAMYINIPDSETENNKGSCYALVNYLEKENRRIENKHKQECWFNGINNSIINQEVRVKIDNNIAKLGRDDAKFYLINISPSQKEIKWLKEQFGNQGAEAQLKLFAVKVMNQYAKNFKRNSIENNADLLWYGKLEHYRYYKHNDSEVKNGLLQKGEIKGGEQMHIQIIVSRKTLPIK